MGRARPSVRMPVRLSVTQYQGINLLSDIHAIRYTNSLHKVCRGHVNFLKNSLSESHTVKGVKKCQPVCSMVIDRFAWESSLSFHCFVRYKRHVAVHCAVQYTCFDSFCPTSFFVNSRSEDGTITYYHLFPPTIGHRSWSLTLFGEFIYDSQNSVRAKRPNRWLQHQTQVHTHWFLERKLQVPFLCKEEPQGQHLTQQTIHFIIPTRLTWHNAFLLSKVKVLLEF